MPMNEARLRRALLTVTYRYLFSGRKRAHEMKHELHAAGIPLNRPALPSKPADVAGRNLAGDSSPRAGDITLLTRYLPLGELDGGSGEKGAVGHQTGREAGGGYPAGGAGEGAGEGAPFTRDALAMQELTKDLVPRRPMVVYHKAVEGGGEARDDGGVEGSLAVRSNLYLKVRSLCCLCMLRCVCVCR